MKGKIKSFIYVLTANFLILFLGLVLSFVLPKSTTVEDYGYYQIFLLYSSYVGLAFFGYNDGLYLFLGGKNKKNIDIKQLSFFFWILLIYLIILSAILFIAIHFIVENNTYKFIILCVIIVLFLQGLNSFFSLTDQATSQLNKYSIISTMEKFLLVVLIIIGIVFDKLTLYNIVLSVLISKTFVLVINLVINRKVVFTKLTISKQNLLKIKTVIKLGLPLTIYGILSMLMTGLGKFFVEYNFNIRDFAIFTFSFSTMSIIIQLINSVSITLYPTLSTLNINKTLKIVGLVENKFLLFEVLILLSFFPIIIIIEFWLPNYINSVPIIATLYPLLIFQSKISGIYSVVLKSQKKSKNLLINSIIAVFLQLVFVLVVSVLKLPLIYYSYSTILGYFAWYITNLISFRKIFDAKIYLNPYEYIVIIIFIILVNFKQYIATILFLIILLSTIVYFDRKFYCSLMSKTKEDLFSKNK